MVTPFTTTESDELRGVRHLPHGTPAVFFDLDGTLLRPPALEVRFFFALLRSRLFTWRGLLRTARLLHRDRHLREKPYLEGLPTKVLGPFIDHWVATHLPHLLYHDMQQRLERYRQDGLPVILVTHCPDLLSHPVGTRLGCTAVLSPRTLKTLHHHYTGELDRGGLPFIDKGTAVQQVIRTSGVDLEASYAFGNSRHDLPLLRLVGHPTIVNPTRTLTRHLSQMEHVALRLTRHALYVS